MTSTETELEDELLEKLRALKYAHRTETVGFMMWTRRLRSKALRLAEAALISPKQQGSFA